MESGGRASVASSSAFCPACGKPIDALRAGQVAILDGAFRYFCNAECKGSYVDTVSKRPSLDAMTADPPPVASASRSAQPPIVASGVREQPRERVPSAPFFPPPPEVASDVDAGAPDDELTAAPPSVRLVSRAQEVDEDGDSHEESDRDVRTDSSSSVLGEPQESPSTLRSPSVNESEAEAEAPSRAAPTSRRSEDDAEPPALFVRRVVAAAPAVGVAAGVLASVVSLAGEHAAALKLPLALVAALVCFARRIGAPKSEGESSPLVVVAPVAAASLVAIVSAVRHHVHADAHASFVGLAAAAALIVDILLSRARRDVIAARLRTNRALAVSARVVRGDGVVELDASQVKPGEQVLVEAGETIPVDGIVVASEEAEVAPWLDSPSLVRKADGHAVVAGAVVVSGRLRVNATFSGLERAWLRLTRGDSASSTWSPTSGRAIEHAAPLVAFVRRSVDRGALLGAVVVAGAVYADNGSWLDVAIAACGGAYALAAAASVSAAAVAHARGHVSAQRRGIVYKDADAFDAAARADVAVLCSRGTILLGEPEIVAALAIGKDGPSSKGWLRSPTPSLAVRLGSPAVGTNDRSDIARVLAIAAGAEMSSTHPFAAAIMREARARGVPPDNMRSALGHSGLGVTALAANGDRVIVGSRAFLLQEKVSVAIADARTSELEAEGRSVLLVAVGGRLVGLLALQDGLRPGARAAVQRLHDSRIEPVLLSGEARDTCETIARALDIEHVRPEILPVDRGAEVRSLADGGRIVAALGHASTDDGALGAADVSIAMEAAGAAPGEWAVAIASDDIRDAALALTVPRACRDRARVAVIVGGLTQALGAIGIAFGVAPAIVPVLGVLAAVAVVSIVREPSYLDRPAG
jgi:Cu+-exporting ATPase